MPTKMLIDAAHPEETRVVVLRDGKVEEFDFEAANRRQLRGNIYLAKVTRVEPSLQAAFIDYGGNRHGFLAFSEIHPDYYQIPFADRQALLAEEEEAEHAANDDDESEEAAASADDNGNGEADAGDGDGGDGDTGETEAGAAARDSVEEVSSSDGDAVESVGGDDALEEVPVRKSKPRRSYKIQEVIKKRQILLVQVVKEERGNKGAALTTYLSLAGRYSVLMPNTARGGGISRKIINASDRKRLKGIVSELDVPEGMGVILRTAGAARTKTEIKRDFEYLLRLWENVRELTLKSVAPALVYEEGSLVKRAIRDLYTKDIDQVQVAGDEAYREAKDFMRMLMPSHAKNIQPYRDSEPLFAKNKIEAQLDAMFSPRVTMKSGGYIIINQTEALVSIDVNSGRSTREHNIEDTALKTNLEAADEVARQLRLRDLAGLIVIDFIDMEEKRNNRNVERRLKDALRHDRARIQVGRISHFGLMEMSRQRIRAGVLESTTQLCPHCEGTGHVRSVESVSLHLLRSIESELLKGKPTDLTLRCRTEVALYVLNQKRTHLRELEERFGVIIAIEADDSVSAATFDMVKGEPARPTQRDAVVRPVSVEPDEDLLDAAAEAAAEVDADADEEAEAEDTPTARSEEEGGGRRRRRRRRRRGSGGDSDTERSETQENGETEAVAGTGEQPDVSMGEREGEGDGDGQPSSGRRRRRGRRGGRRHRGETSGADQEAETGDVTVEAEAPVADGAPSSEAETEAAVPEAAGEEAPAEQAQTDATAEVTAEAVTEADEEPKPKKRPARRPRRKAPAAEAAEAAPAPVVEEAVQTQPEQAEPMDAEPVAAEPAPREPEPVLAEAPREKEAAPAPEPVSKTAEPAGPPKKGWWQRRNLFGD
jgi:ribonuclease E